MLALDIATKTGWALNTKGAQASGTWDLKEFPDEGGGMRFIRLAAKLRAIHKAFPIELLVYEDVGVQAGPRANSRATKALVQLTGAVRAFCEEQLIPYEGVPLSSIKSHALNGKKGKKEDILAAAVAKWGPEVVTDDNVADALWLLDLALDKYLIEKPS